ncbi:hypothetical protein E2C06_32520 [Dankookia rubra]|uniref:Uncharacterized protein n=1 Tax=Dankookia rubra TaxID=1442381 RepID=A0A4R5Q7I3_9PROT|nr:hypothetical protein [Dankookia rubra]TDH58449.1 hypothetical protein E2C06_32520 [Dankookia rubra]
MPALVCPASGTRQCRSLPAARPPAGLLVADFRLAPPAAQGTGFPAFAWWLEAIATTADNAVADRSAACETSMGPYPPWATTCRATVFERGGLAACLGE